MHRPLLSLVIGLPSVWRPFIWMRPIEAFFLSWYKMWKIRLVANGGAMTCFREQYSTGHRRK